MRYLTFRAGSESASALVTASAAISAFHKLNGFVSPCADPRIAAIIEGAKRSFSQPVAQKEPLSKETLKAMWENEIGEDYVGSLWQWRNCWIMTLMFRTCARFADICKLKKSSFKFKKEGIEIFFQFCKNDQRGVGHTVKRTTGDRCANMHFDAEKRSL